MERMHIRLGMLIKTTMAMLCAGIALTSIDAVAQGTSKFDKTKLVGAWTLVSIDNTLPDGKRMQGFGSNDGVVIFEPNGRFVRPSHALIFRNSRRTIARLDPPTKTKRWFKEA
jgi:hypothetical protein